MYDGRRERDARTNALQVATCVPRLDPAWRAVRTRWAEAELARRRRRCVEVTASDERRESRVSFWHKTRLHLETRPRPLFHNAIRACAIQFRTLVTVGVQVDDYPYLAQRHASFEAPRAPAYVIVTSGCVYFKRESRTPLARPRVSHSSRRPSCATCSSRPSRPPT